LNKLTIQQAPITDDGMRGLIERLSETGKLKSLNVYKCPKITDDGLKQIGRLTSLERLFLNNNDGLTSGLLEEIAHLKNLNRLEIDSVALDEADLVHLPELSKLETLGMSCSHSTAKLTDLGLAYVSRLPSLRSVTIQGARITDDGVNHLIQLKGLESLGLSHTEITDQGVAALANGLPNLLQLGLTGTRVTDSGMVDVGKLTKLEWLWLDETQVGDEGIQKLSRLTKLQYIYIDRSSVSSEGHQQLRRDHPTARITLQ
jgi:Leucine-rich repeat (LRR) protein